MNQPQTRCDILINCPAGEVLPASNAYIGEDVTMNKLFYMGMLSLVVAIGAGIAMPALATTEPTRLQAPLSGDAYRPGEAFVLSLPEGIAAHLLQGLALELDGIDVTALVVAQGNKRTYRPVTALSHGRHALRLVRYGEDGSVSELGFWEIDIQHADFFRNARVQGELNLEMSQRLLASQNVKQSQNSNTHVQANGQYTSQFETGTWRTEAQAIVSYSDDPALSLTGREADIPSFSINSSNGALGVSLGDQIFASADLLNDGYQRRGLAFSAALPTLNSAINVFGAKTNQSVGIDDGLGLSDTNNRFSGAKWQYQPLNKDIAQLVFSSSFLQGKSSQADFGSIETAPNYNTQTNEGDAWNIVADALFFEKHMRIRLERASTHYDFDGIDQGLEAEEDDAYSAIILFDLTAQYEKPTQINFGMEKQRIGTRFKSIANKQLPTDKEYVRTFLDTKNDNWSFNASVANERNNLDNNLDYAQTRTSQWVVGGGLKEHTSPVRNSLFALLGQPTLNWYLTSARFKDHYTPVGYWENNLQTRSANISTVFEHPRWNWLVGVNQDSLTDHTGWQPQTRTRTLMFNTSIKIANNYFLAVGWQLQGTHYVEEQLDTHRQLYSLETRAELIPERLSANLAIGANQNNAQEDPYAALRDKSAYASANINWRIKKPERNRLGWDLSLALIRNEFSDYMNNLNNIDQYQVQLKFNTTLPNLLPETVQ